MILKPGSITKYGIPYQGSKTGIIDQIARFFPNADNFYDLFGGGFSVSHYMLEHRRQSFGHIHYNEIRPGLCDLIKDSINGKYNYDVFKPEWISRERFENEKQSSAYIQILWSFGNNGKDYLFGKEIEEEKRCMHQAVVFNEFNDLFKEIFGFSKWPSGLNITGRRLYLGAIARKAKRAALQQLQQLQQLEMTNLDYKQVKIKESSVVYCDIPYKGTAGYSNSFSHDEFFDWASEQKSPVFVSEYEIKDKRFFLLKEISKRTTFSSGGLKNTPVIERMYGNEMAYELIRDALLKKGLSRKSSAQLGEAANG